MPEPSGEPHRSTSDQPVPLEAVIHTAELNRRGARPANHESENHSLAYLMQETVRSPGTILDKLTKSALDLCGAHSAGIGLLQTENGGPIVRWHAVAGQWARFGGSILPRDSSPCATALEQDYALLLSCPARHYALPSGLAPPVVEMLLVPIRLADEPIGALWIVAHDKSRRFDREDARLLNHLSQCAATAHQLLTERKYKQRLASIVTSSEDAIVSKSLEGIVQTWNAAAERLFGYTAEQAVGRHVSFLIPPDRAGEEDRIIARIKAGQRIEPYDTRRLRSDGRSIPVSLSVSPIMDEAGRVAGASKIARDITERLQAKRQQRESEQRFRALIEQIQDYAIFLTGPQGRPTTWNQGVQRVLGFTEAEFIDQNIVPAIFTPEDIRSGVAQAEFDQAARHGSASNDRWMQRKDGSRFWAAGITTALHNEAGELVGFTKIMRDQTKQKHLEDDLRGIAAQLSEANRRKTEFLAILGHELRNPLSPILTGLEVLKLVQDNPAEREETRHMIERQARQMSRLIDDLTDVSRITRGKLELRKTRVALADAVQSATEATRPTIDAAGHGLTVTLPPQPLFLDADPSRLAQIFSNLLSNASKYTPPGGRIRLSAKQQGSAVTVTVQDNGIGLPANVQDNIFDMFMQSDRQSAADSRGQGLGIGLTLVKQLVKMHGGKITVHSEGAHKGSEFSVELPLLEESPPTGPKAPSAETASPSSRHRILVVEDNPEAADLLSKTVTMLGNEVRTAYDGSQGIEVAAAFRPAIALIDLAMPHMNGYETAQYIQAQSWGRDMTLVALTGWAQEADKQRTEAAGFDHYLLKPVDPPKLQRLLAALHQNPS